MEIRNRHLLFIDAVSLTAIIYIGFAIRLEGHWSADWSRTAALFALTTVPIKLVVFHQLGLYRRLWAYAGGADAEQIALAGFLGGVLAFPIGAWLLPTMDWTPHRVPLSVLASTIVLGIAAAAAPRYLIRAMHRRGTPQQQRRREDLKLTLIVGAGRAGEMVARELRRSSHLDFELVGFLDDDRFKHGHRLGGLPVLGPVSDLPAIVEEHKVTKVIIAMPTAPGPKLREVVELARSSGVRVRTVPGLFEIISGRKSVAAIREIQIQDLLRREPVTTDLDEVGTLAHGRTVLVTGAGGSIGSELCRQLAEVGPARLVLLGHGENSIFGIHNELTARFPDIEFIPKICDIRDRQGLDRIFDRYRPDAVFHAAAHKHVPLMEFNVHEAVLNNVVGTRNVAECAAEYGATRFVLISSDKAVRPTNMMGATKRVAEQVVQEIAATSGRDFVAVRFGNVLGSRGSVVPTFLKQIEDGGPVTVTHPDMTRYFMTIPEAVQLVLQAAMLGQGGDVLVLDMGEPVRVLDLAHDLIRLAGFEPERDVHVAFTGIRAGEKLYEELFFNSETAAPTKHPKILRARNAERTPGLAEYESQLVSAAASGADDGEIRRMIQLIVPGYRQSGPQAVVQEQEGAEDAPVAGVA